jgi:hypothetical protein
MDEKNMKSLQMIKSMMVLDGIFIAGIGTYLSFYTEYRLVGFFLFVIVLSSTATVFTICSNLLNKK